MAEAARDGRVRLRPNRGLPGHAALWRDPRELLGRFVELTP